MEGFDLLDHRVLVDPGCLDTGSSTLSDERHQKQSNQINQTIQLHQP